MGSDDVQLRVQRLKEASSRKEKLRLLAPNHNASVQIRENKEVLVTETSYIDGREASDDAD